MIETKGMVGGHLAHVRKLVEICITKYGECTQMKVKKKKKKEQNKKKENKKRKLDQTVELE